MGSNASGVTRKGGKKNRKWGRNARSHVRMQGGRVGLKGEPGLAASRTFSTSLGVYVGPAHTVVAGQLMSGRKVA